MDDKKIELALRQRLAVSKMNLSETIARQQNFKDTWPDDHAKSIMDAFEAAKIKLREQLSSDDNFIVFAAIAITKPDNHEEVGYCITTYTHGSYAAVCAALDVMSLQQAKEMLEHADGN